MYIFILSSKIYWKHRGVITWFRVSSAGRKRTDFRHLKAQRAAPQTTCWVVACRAKPKVLLKRSALKGPRTAIFIPSPQSSVLSTQS